jgi:hypothetical protein
LAEVKGIVVMALLIVAFGVAVFALTRPHTQHSGLSAAELRWVRGYGGWWSSQLGVFDAALAASTQSTVLSQLRRPFAALRACDRAYGRRAGVAPKSLRDVDSLSRQACSRGLAAADELRRRPTVPDPRRTRILLTAEDSMISADRALTDHLVLERSLPTASRPGGASRSDARYSAAATDVLDYNLDVRCWSPKDWAAIGREARALGTETARRFFGAANAFEGTANLSPQTCASLDRLAYKADASGGTALAVALATLGREGEIGSSDRAGAEAECDGLQDVRGLATKLGASHAESGRLAAVALRLYRGGRLGERSPKCRNGGPWDMSGSRLWP